MASVSALLVTRDGCNTFYYFMLITHPFLTLIPVYFYPLLCLFLSSVTTIIGFIPAFSAKVNGMISSASAYALKMMASSPFNVFICSDNLYEI